MPLGGEVVVDGIDGHRRERRLHHVPDAFNGIEIPNSTREVVRFKEIISSSTFEKSKSRLTICLGKDIVGHRRQE